MASTDRHPPPGLNLRRGLVALVALSVCPIVSYAVFIDGVFAHQQDVPGWIVAAGLATIFGAVAAAGRWFHRQPPSTLSYTPGELDVYVPMLAIGGASQAIGVGTEVLSGMPAGWLVGPVTVAGYALFLVWFQGRYGVPNRVRQDHSA